MIRVTVLYPTQEGSTFDHEYYRDTHMPLVRQTLGGALKRTSIERGLGTAEPGKPAPYMASCHLEFESPDAFAAAFGPNAATLMGDLPNFTNVQPVVQISEIIE